MIRRLTPLMILAVILVATIADAQPQRPTRPDLTREGRWDFGLQTRYNWGAEYDRSNGSSITLHDDLGWGFGFGYHISNKFNLGMNFGWRSVPYDAVAVDATDPAATSRYSGKLSTSTIGLTGDWNILPGKITPYINGGLAWMLIDTNIFAGWSNGCWWDPWWGYVCGSVPATYGKTTGAYTLGGGMRFEINDSFFIRAGYERGWIGSGSIDGTNLLRIDLGLMN